MGIFDNLTKHSQSNTAISQPIQEIKKKILVVEDDQSLAAALVDKLSKTGYNVLKAENGEQGLELVKTEKPDMILLDIVMPKMDGISMLHELREIPEFQNLPVIVLTNAGGTDNIRQSKVYYNAVDFLIKSNVSLEEITQKIQSIIGPAN